MPTDATRKLIAALRLWQDGAAEAALETLDAILRATPPPSRWDAYQVLGFKASVLEDLGRLDEADRSDGAFGETAVRVAWEHGLVGDTEEDLDLVRRILRACWRASGLEGAPNDADPIACATSITRERNRRALEEEGGPDAQRSPASRSS